MRSQPGRHRKTAETGSIRSAHRRKERKGTRESTKRIALIASVIVATSLFVAVASPSAQADTGSSVQQKITTGAWG